MEQNHLNGYGHSDSEIESQGDAEKAPKFVIPTAKLEEVKVTDFMRDCIDKVASSEGFKSYDVKVDHGAAVGDGFIGILMKVIIFENNSDKKLSLVLKSPPTNIARRHEFKSMDLFEREIRIYNEILPEFVKFQEERKINKSNGFFNFPKCYHAEFDRERDEAILIMEDLREDGYKMWDKFLPATFEHSKLVAASLGRLHAISFAFKAQKPELFEKFKNLDDFWSKSAEEESFTKMMEANLQRAAGALDESDSKRRNKVLKLSKNVGQLFKDLTSPTLAEPFSVVSHGDCWSNNFMFQYKVNHFTFFLLFEFFKMFCSVENQKKSFCLIGKFHVTVRL